jgi:YHS domain-containing protein
LFLLLRIILILLIVRALWLLVRGILEGVGYRMLDPSPPGVKLVRDPVCGVFVTPGRALTERSGGETAYFCSEKCRNQWRGKS